jgi:hypothetical protein
MKTRFRIKRYLLLLGLVIQMAAVWGQNQNTTQMVCMGNQEYHVDAHPNPTATYTWSLTGGGTITSGNGTNTINVNWTTAGGPYLLSVFTTVNGCAGPPQTLEVTVVEAPVGPSLAGKIPPGMSVCDGTPVSATFNPGTGGIGCTDEFEYSYDNSGTWVAYTPGASLPTTGHTLVEIRGRRAGCNASLGCNETPWEVLASWTVTTALPVIVTINPSLNPVCEGAAVTYTATVLNGGATPTYAWRINGGAVVSITNSYTYIPVSGDVITCEVLSSEPCSAPNPATGTFNPSVSPLPSTSGIWHN